MKMRDMEPNILNEISSGSGGGVDAEGEMPPPPPPLRPVKINHKKDGRQKAPA